MKFMHFSLLACFFAFSLNAADEPSYIFEAKGEFAKELKSWNSTSVGVSSKIDETIFPIRTAPAV